MKADNMTRRQTNSGQRTLTVGRIPYCSVCAAIQNIDQKLGDEERKAAMDAIWERMDRLPLIRAAYRRRHRYW